MQTDKKFRDLTGQKFGSWTAQWPAARTACGMIFWLCVCDCGTMRIVSRSNLRCGQSTSCGCLGLEKLRRRSLRNDFGKTHGKSRTVEGHLLYSVRHRAKQLGLPFNLTIDDIVIPDICPLLNVPIKKDNLGRGYHPTSPSVDRIIPKLGYVRGNIQIISARANLIKNDATLEEFELIAKNWRVQCL